MPAVTADTLTLPRLNPATLDDTERPVRSVTTGPKGFEGEGFPVIRAFAGVGLRDLDPFVHMDQMGEVDYAPGEPKGTPWHPHRGFETVTYMIDGTFLHQDSHGGGGVIENGATQWMTAGAGILHIETPPEELVLSGGLFHGIQLWVNLPAKDKFTPPRYQSIEGGKRRSWRLMTEARSSGSSRGASTATPAPARRTRRSPWRTRPSLRARRCPCPGNRTTTLWSTFFPGPARSGPRAGRYAPASWRCSAPVTG